jgi:hypothetical protein
MNTLSLSATSAVPSQVQVRPAASGRGLGMLLIAEALLSFAPVAVLGVAIG